MLVLVISRIYGSLDYVNVASKTLISHWDVSPNLEKFYSSEEKARKTIDEMQNILKRKLMKEVQGLSGIINGHGAVRFKQIGQLLESKLFKIVEREVE